MQNLKCLCHHCQHVFPHRVNIVHEFCPRCGRAHITLVEDHERNPEEEGDRDEFTLG